MDTKPTRHYTVATMKKFRGQIIAALKEIKMALMNNYSLSSANELSAHFQLNLKSRSLTEQSATKQKTDVENKLKTIFPDIAISFIGRITDGSLRLDLEKEYDKKHPPLTENDIVEKKADKKTEPNAKQQDTKKDKKTVAVKEETITPAPVPISDLANSKKFSPAAVAGIANEENNKAVSRPPRIFNIRPVLPLTESMLNYEINGDTLREILSLCERRSTSEEGKYDLYWVEADVLKRYFGRFHENRDIIEAHIESLEDSYETHGYLFTIAFVNEQLMEIDAQHRIETAIRNNVGIHFMIMVGWAMEEVTVYNVNNKNWGDLEYLNSYSKAKLPAYVTLKEFYDSHEFDLSTCEILFKNYRFDRGKKASEDTFRNKKINITNDELERARYRAEKIFAMKEYNPKGWSSRNFVECMIFLLNNPKYKHEEMLRKLKLAKEDSIMLNAKGSLRLNEYVVFMVKLFNKNKGDEEQIHIPSRFID